MKNYVTFIVSIFVSFLLWVIVNLNGEFEENFKSKIVVKNLNSDKAIKNDYAEFVNLRIRGQGWKLLPFYFITDPQVVIDLENVNKNLNLNLLGNNRVKFLIPKDVRIVRIEPETLSFEIDKKISRKVPVVFDYEIKKENYDLVQPPKLIPDSVIISGAESIISKINSISTEKFLVQKSGQNIKVKLSLVNPNYKLVELSDDFVEVSFSVEQLVEREFTVPVQITDLPIDKEVILFPPDVKVVIRGGLSKIVEVSSESYPRDTLIKAFVSYRDVIEDKTGLVKPHVIIPENFKLVSISPEGLEYIIRQK